MGSPKNFESTPISQASAACPGIAPTTEHCPSNFGVPLKNGIPDPVAAVTTCSPSRLKDLQLYKEARDVGLAWKEKTVTLAKNLAWKPTDCNSLSLPPSLAPKDLQKYQRLNLRPEQKYESGPSVFTFPVSTKRYLEQHQELQCPEVKSSRKVFDDEISDPQLTTNSLFAGLHPALGCNAESTLRTEAIRLGMNPLAYLDTSTSSPKSWSEIPGKPNDSCSVYTTDFVADAQSPEFLGKYSASEIPEACLQTGAHCDQELTGLGSGEVGATGIDLEHAAKVEGFSAVQAMMPRAKLDCSGPNCVQIQVLQQGDTILAQASTKLSPLLLWGNNVPLSYQDQRKSELTFAR